MQAIAHENSKRSAPENIGKLKSTRARAKYVGDSELREITRAVSFCQINKIILEAIARENSKRSAPKSNCKLTSMCAREKKVGISKLRVIARVVLGQINNIGSERVQKFKKVCFREHRQIKEHESTREKC